MDFIMHLLALVGHFVALPTHFNAHQLAKRLSLEIFRLYGLPKTNVSDRDPPFVSTFWKHLFKAQGTTLKFISTLPSTNRRTNISP